MDESKSERWGALAGVLFVVLVVVAALIGGTPPKPSDTAQTIESYFRDNQDALRIGSYLNGLAMIAVLWFLATLFGRLRRAEGGNGRVSGIALTGAVAAVAIAMVANGFAAFAALHPVGSTGTFLASTILLGYAGFAISLFVAATSIVVLRTKLLPQWFGAIGAALAVFWLVAAACVSTESDTINTVGFVAFLAWGVWLIVLSVLLYRAPSTTTTS